MDTRNRASIAQVPASRADVVGYGHLRAPGARTEERGLPHLGDTARAMSQGNVESVERFLKLHNRRQIDAWVEMMAPDVEWHVDPEDPDTTVFRGPEAVKRYGLTWAEMMDVKVEVREIFEASDNRVVAWTRIESRGGLSGASAGMDLAFIFKLRDGLVARVQETQDKREALEAVGLSEQGAHADS
jgi:ketosteroid isomerase-like protein